MIDQMTPRILGGKRLRIDVADKRDGRLLEFDLRKIYVQLIGGGLHQRAVERAGGCQARISLACRPPCRLRSLDGGKLT